MIERIHSNLAEILSNGSLGQRKAVMGTHIAEIRIADDRLIPIYRIPVDGFRAQGRNVDRTMHHANHPTDIPGKPLLGHLTSSRPIQAGT